MNPPTVNSQNQTLARSPRVNYRWLVAFAGWLVVALLLARAGQVAFDHLTWPFDNNWESQGLDTVKIIQGGGNPYDSDVYARGPLVYTMYTPIYYYLCSLFPAPVEQPFFASRLVSGIAAGIAALCIATAGGRQGARGWLIGALAAAVWLNLWPVLKNAFYMKCDMLALAFSCVAISLLHHTKGRSRWLPLVALLLVFSFWSKQTFVSATACALIFMLLTNRRGFAVLFLSLVGFFTLFTAASYAIWGEGFFACLVSGSGHAMHWHQFTKVLWQAYAQPLNWFLTLLAFVAAGASFRAWRTSQASQSPFALYFAVSVVFALATLPKEGSTINYLIEPLAAGALTLTAWLAHWRPARPHAMRLGGAAVLGVGGLLLLEIVLFPSNRYTYANPANQRSALYEQAALQMELERISSEPMRVLPFFALKSRHSLRHEFCLNDSFLYYSMWRSGQLSTDAFQRDIEAGYYDVIMWPLNISPEDTKHGVTPLPGIWESIHERYQPVSESMGYLFMVRQEVPQH